MADKSGTRGLGENGILQAAESVWGHLLAKILDTKWMRTEPVGNVDVYREVFEKITSIGQFITKIGDESDIPEVILSGEDDSPITPTFSALSKKRRYDPDINLKLSDPSNIGDSASLSSSVGPPPPNKKLRRLHEGERIEAVNALATSISEVSRAMMAPPYGTDEVFLATNIILNGLLDKLHSEEWVQAVNHLAENPVKAALLLKFTDDDGKTAFIRTFLH
ncbi:hypothetical protein F4861DRAFT_544449 [Xylaria intraflava]|nr:hypothetical protein F4861DRAFT_544449 [Xylaria intraflava]